MKLFVFSEKVAIKCSPKEGKKVAMIRIHDPEDDIVPLEHESSFVSVMDVFFHDLAYRGHELPADIQLMTREHAEKIVSFSKGNQDVDSMVVHCTAGISRSSAVAIGISWLFDLKEEENYLFSSNAYYPNEHVLEIFAQILGVDELKLKELEVLKKKRIEDMKIMEPFTW